MKFHFGEGFLKPQVRIEARGPGADIYIDDAELLDVEIVEAHRGRDTDAPVHRAKRSVAVEKIEGEEENLVHESLLALAEKIGAPRASRADVARSRQAAAVEKGIADSGENEERAIAEKRHVAFQLVPVEGIPEAAFHVGMLASGSVAVPIGHGDEPAVGLGVEHLVGWRELWSRGRRWRRRFGSLDGLGIFSRSRRRGRRGRRRSFHLRNFGKPRRRWRGRRKRGELDFAGCNLARFQLEGGLGEFHVAFTGDFQIVSAGPEVNEAKDAFGIGSCDLLRAGFEIVQNYAGRDDGPACGVAHDSFESAFLLRGLAGDTLLGRGLLGGLRQEFAGAHRARTRGENDQTEASGQIQSGAFSRNVGCAAQPVVLRCP